MAYSNEVIDHYENPRNAGKMDDADANVGTGMVGAPACGCVLSHQFNVSVYGTIEDAKFTTYGSGSALGTSYIVTWVDKGLSLVP